MDASVIIANVVQQLNPSFKHTSISKIVFYVKKPFTKARGIPLQISVIPKEKHLPFLYMMLDLTSA